MAWTPKQNITKREFFMDRLSMTLGSLTNLHSNNPTPPDASDIFNQAIDLTERIWSFGKRFDSFPELEKRLEEKFDEHKERVLGRYHSSELYNILTNKVTPADFFKPKKFTEEERQRMYWGTIIHEGIQKLFQFEEKKYEMKVGAEITLVCKIDLELENGIWEFKTTENIEAYEEVPSWYNYQCQAYLECKNLESMNLMLIGWGFSRKIFKVKRDKELWKEMVEKLGYFHTRVKQLNKPK